MAYFPRYRVSRTDTELRTERTGQSGQHLDTRWFISRSLFVLADRKWIAEGQTVT